MKVLKCKIKLYQALKFVGIWVYLLITYPCTCLSFLTLIRLCLGSGLLGDVDGEVCGLQLSWLECLDHVFVV